MKFKILLSLLLAVLMLLTACTPKTPLTPPDDGTNPPSTDGNNTPSYATITIADALTLCGEPGNVTTERYYIRATIEAITNGEYGSMVITDETGSIAVYGTYSADGEKRYSELDDRPYSGDTVLLYCILQNYNGTKEVKNARLIEFTHNKVEIDPSLYPAKTIAEARAAATGTQMQVTGTVARITYSNGQKPAGLILMDENGSSIYVYDAETAGRVKIGSKITIAASKTYWILSDEQHSAAKFDYPGCNQLENVTLISLDDKIYELPFDKVPTSTVKALMDTPFSEDITTAVYKVTALVKKAPGAGFVNYYLNDLDGTTGSYVYTQCNGSDFDWLDAFDGKICTVYMTLLNAKASGAGCVWRLLPIAVVDEGFTFDTAKTAEHVVTYYGLTQFRPTYSGDPALELVSSVSSELLGFTGATLSYTTSDEHIATVLTENGKPVLHCLESGEVEITVTATHGGKTHSEKITITVTRNLAIDSTNVAGAINTEVGKNVAVSGIVGPSLVNKVGFYLIDDTGVIAVLVDTDTMATLTIGDKVTLTATRHVNTKGGSGYFGQSCLKDAIVVANEYGNHDYSEKTFVTDKTLADLDKMDISKDYTTTVYVLKATVVVEESAYYTNIYLQNGSAKVRLYSSSANQYNWLKAYKGQEVTVEVAPCNWNDKTDYTGCVLAVVTENGKVLNELNFGK